MNAPASPLASLSAARLALNAALTVSIVGLGACDGPAGSRVSLPLGADSRLLLVGVGDGAHMAQQFHFAHSSIVDGVAVVAAGPYGCALGDPVRASGVCIAGGRLDLAKVSHAARDAAAAGEIDTLNHLIDDRVWVSPGWRDSPVADEVAFAAFELYEDFTRAEGLAFAERCDGDARSCAPSLASDLLDHLAPVADRPAGAAALADPPARQLPPARGPWRALSAYSPARCADGGCDLLVVLGSCDGSSDALLESLVSRAAAHRLVAVHVAIDDPPCWDWRGRGSADYRSRRAPQIDDLFGLVASLGAGNSANFDER